MTLVLRRHTGPRPPLYQTFTLCPGNPLRGRWILKQVDRRRVSGEVGDVLQRWPHRQRYGLAAAGSAVCGDHGAVAVGNLPTVSHGSWNIRHLTPARQPGLAPTQQRPNRRRRQALAIPNT